MVQAHCRNGQKTTSQLRFLICGVVCYGVLAPTITSALGEYDALRQIAAQERLEQPRRGDGGGYGGGGGGYDDRVPYELRSYLDPDMLTGGGGGDLLANNGMDSDYAGDSDGLGGVDRLESYMDKFLGLDSVGGGQEPLDEAASDDTPKIRFPKLTSEQKNFGIHPGYLSYYNRELQHIEDELEKRKGGRDRTSKSGGGKVNGDEIADDPFDSAEPKAKSEGEKGLTFGKVRQAPKGTISEEDISAADQVLKKADSDGGVIITGLGGNGDGFGEGSGGLQIGDVSFTVIVAVCSAVAAFTIVLAGVVYHRLQRNTKAAEDVEYPAYGVTAAAAGAGGQLGRTGSGSAGSPTSGGSLSGDRKLAQNAQMYHYQHQKQQMIAFDSHQNGGTRNRLGSEDNDSDEGEEGDYTVYECPGLAPTGEMEVRNPMFSDDQTTPKANGK